MEISYPLVVATTCQRLGLGLFVCALIASTWMGISLPMNIIAFIALVTLGVGGLASAVHLGRPKRFFNAFTNFKSHLTQEALITPFLGVLLAICAGNGHLYQVGEFAGAVALWLSFILAVAFLVSTGLVYQLDARPAWNTPLTLIVFLATAAQAGMLFTAALAFAWNGSISGAFAVALALVLAACFVAQYLFIQHLKSVGYGVAVNVTDAPYRGLFAFWFLCGVAGISLCASLALWRADANAAVLAVILSVAGIAAWTALFYKTSLLMLKFPMYDEDLNTFF